MDALMGSSSHHHRQTDSSIVWCFSRVIISGFFFLPQQQFFKLLLFGGVLSTYYGPQVSSKEPESFLLFCEVTFSPFSWRRWSLDLQNLHLDPEPGKSMVAEPFMLWMSLPFLIFRLEAAFRFLFFYCNHCV